MDKWDWYIGLGFVLVILGFAGLLQRASRQGLAPGYTFLAYVALLIGAVFMAYGAAKSLGSRGEPMSKSPATPPQTPVSIPSQASQSVGMLFCRNCGARLPSDSKFCNRCGTSVST